MNQQRRAARDYLNGAPLSTFWQIVTEAKVSDKDKIILDMRFVRGLSVAEISQTAHMSEDNIKKVIAKNYDKIAKLI